MEADALGQARLEKIYDLADVYHSDYNSSFYYDTPQNILLAYLDGYISW